MSLMSTARSLSGQFQDVAEMLRQKASKREKIVIEDISFDPANLDILIRRVSSALIAHTFTEKLRDREKEDGNSDQPKNYRARTVALVVLLCKELLIREGKEEKAYRVIQLHSEISERQIEFGTKLKAEKLKSWLNFEMRDWSFGDRRI